MYDFNRCKLCGKNTAEPKYKLKGMTLYACSQCDFHFIDALDTFPTDYPDKAISDKHRSFIESKLPQNRQQLEVDLKFVSSHIDLNEKRCLDIGTGVGMFAFLLKQAGADVSAIEPQQIFREFAQEKFQLELRPELADDTYWQENYAEYFDVVTIWDTLEHVNFPLETVQAAVKLLKPGGYLFLDTPSRDSLFYRSSEWSYQFSFGTRPLLLNKLYSPKPYCHKQLFTRKQLWWLLEKVGLQVVEQSPLHKANKKLVVACRKA
ncbi:2-polyprenyl-6-hydroxyphenyl methylase / 3-demethylubiquinone-9 3-methyltransferase [Malonomonas rubra DSM 5091]|uniref:2-polyprenyl-6-hydroxyphenyl methylase / 3-demethylubiquinone-9 3-methyltransferase n=2 Tax=Malonomonas rubra TaxID=57040 RepID=A0A1M6E244_MALRU|nr:2-polyprenyl-6-hydroxyphenyl methylase / 3-demethylubiquinone-9 3-methyltransferase [Malonomonas rubra DSM 5091]